MKIVTDIAAMRKPCEAVKEDENIVELAELMFKAMQELKAQGLSANQIGLDKRVFVMLTKATPICIVNPVITMSKGIVASNEGCLSIPGQIVRVKRPQVIRIKGVNQYFRPVNYKFEGIEARRACHEFDHLRGKLITDYGRLVTKSDKSLKNLLTYRPE